MLILVIVPIKTEAKTLRDFKNELANAKKKKADNVAEKQLKESEITSINQKIDSVSKKITSSEEIIKNLTNEIENLNIEIQEKDLEIKEIMHFLQVSSGESAYLEYIFGAKDMTDFIYRSAITSQLVEYNDKLIAEYNQTIIDNKNKQENLKKELVTLANQQEEFGVQLKALGSELTKMNDVTMTIDEEITNLEKNIKMYEETYKCSLDQEISDCTSKVPYSGNMVRPVQSGRITSNYGNRCLWLNGVYRCSFHFGIDIAGGDTKIYAAAPGVVGDIQWYQSCGGNKIFIWHNVGGNKYTTGYYHLKTINVKIGDVVDQNTVIATMGGGADTMGYDKCSTGQHLHFAVATGHYKRDYSWWSDFEQRNINPVSVVNFPGYGVWFSNRVQRY